jgi:hypothetical protein
MTENNTSANDDDYFDDAERTGAPSAKLKDLNDFVQGEVVDKRQVDKTKFGTNEVELNDDGTPRKQLRIILQTESRNWEKVSKVPTEKDGSPKDPSLDDGKRAIYVPKYTNIYSALGDAIHAADVRKVEIGGWFGVKIVELEDTGKGNPLKKHAAKYKPPVKDAEVDPFEEFDGGSKSEAKADKPAASKVQDTKPVQDETESATAANAPVEEPPF